MSADFYNPYSKHIQWAQGFADIANQLIMMKMMQKMYGGAKPGQSNPNPAAAAMGGQMTPYQTAGIPNQGPIGGQNETGGPGSEDIMRMILAIIGGSRPDTPGYAGF